DLHARALFLRVLRAVRAGVSDRRDHHAEVVRSRHGGSPRPPARQGSAPRARTSVRALVGDGQPAARHASAPETGQGRGQGGGHGGVRRHRRVSDPRVPLPATAATRRGYNPGARPGARGAVRRHVRAAGPAPGRGAPGRPLLREDGRVSLTAYLTLAALVFAIGLFGVLTRRNAIGILLGIELMLNAVNINLVAFARFHGDLLGLVFTLFTIAITVA